MAEDGEADGQRGELPFAALLKEYFHRNIRPKGWKPKTKVPPKRWAIKDFATEVGFSESAVRNWRKGGNPPKDLKPIEDAFFGPDIGGDDEITARLRSDLIRAYDRAQKAHGTEDDTRGVSDDVRREATLAPPEPVKDGASVQFPRAPRLFFGREDALDGVHAILSDRTDRGGAVVLCGLGGVGKTSLAAAYYQRYQQGYSACFWIRAETSETIMEDYMAIGLANAGDGQGTPLRWLVTPGPDTLLIYDNAEDARSLRAYLPPQGGARILVTSNDHAWQSVGTPIEISTWSREVGADFLTARTGQRNAPRIVAETLSGELGGLPLAHEQAAAFCEKLSVSLAEYTKRFERQPIKLLEDEKYAPTEHRRSVAKTFAMAIDAATATHSAAGQFILLVSLLGPHDIPLFVFEENYDCIPDPLKTAIQNGELEEVVAALRSFSLVEFEKPYLSGSEAIRYINLHRLVRLVVLETCDPDTRQAAKISSFRALRAAIGKFDGVAEYTRNYGSNSIEPPMAPRFRAVFPIVRDLVDSEDKEAHEYFIHFYMPMKFGPLYYRYD